jgi:predicted DNA-binding protein
MKKTTKPLSVRISTELDERLEECARRLKMRKHTLAASAIEAAAIAIEKNNYRLVVPIVFKVEQIPAPTATESKSYPDHRPQVALAEDSPKKTANSDPLAEILRITKKHGPKPGPGSGGVPPADKK